MICSWTHMTGSWHRQGELIRLHSLIQIHTVKIMYTNTHNYAHRHTKSKNFLLICLVVAKVVMSMFERLRSGNERRSQIPCWTETSMWRHKVQQSGRKGLERVDIDAVGEHTHTHTRQGLGQQRLPLKSVCSQVGNSLVTVTAFQKSQVTAASHIQVSHR